MSAELPRFSRTLHRFFVAYLRRYFRRSFHAVRTSGPRPERRDRLIVYTNHPSWWDPIHLLLLAAIEFPGLRIFGPMDAEALDRYRMFAKLGAFPVEQDSPRAAAAFVRRSQAIVDAPNASLWLTAEGRFSDSRARPVALKPGLGHLITRLDGAVVVPLALEYPFWNERYPEALSRFGEPIVIDAPEARSSSAWTALLSKRLERTMDDLAVDAKARDPRQFRTVLGGSAGVGGIYDLWRAARALWKGRRFDAAHEQRGPS